MTTKKNSKTNNQELNNTDSQELITTSNQDNDININNNNNNNKTNLDLKNNIKIINPANKITTLDNCNSKKETDIYANIYTLSKALERLRPFAESIITNNKLGLKTVEDALFCIVLGSELGLNPMTSVTLGNLLNRESTLAVWKGKGLGLDAVTSIENIHVFQTSNGLKSYTGVHIITSALNRNNIKHEIIRNATNLYEYFDVSSGKTPILYKEEDIIRNENNFQIVTSLTSKEDYDTHKIQVGITSKVYDLGTIVKFTKSVPIDSANKTGVVTHFEVFTVKMAEKAGLLGKDNWKYLSKMLYDRCIGGGGRIIGAEFLQGIYTNNEIKDTFNDVVVIE